MTIIAPIQKLYLLLITFFVSLVFGCKKQETQVTPLPDETQVTDTTDFIPSPEYGVIPIEFQKDTLILRDTLDRIEDSIRPEPVPMYGMRPNLPPAESQFITPDTVEEHDSLVEDNG